MPKFKAWLETEEGKAFADDRKSKDIFFATYFVANEIKKIDEVV